MLNVITLSPRLRDELDALTETGLYDDEEAFIADAIRTLLAARPDLREAIACKLFERGAFSLGKAAEWSGLDIEVMKNALHRRGITRAAFENPVETEGMARQTLETAGKSAA
jgi:predicted HTH domain antitoxin